MKLLCFLLHNNYGKGEQYCILNAVTDGMAKNISGKYKHFKGKNYEVYCEVTDNYGDKYVLYQQLYGDKSFWIRPYQMFFEEVDDIDDKGSPIIVKRFSIIGKTKSPKQYIENLVKLIREDKIEI